MRTNHINLNVRVDERFARRIKRWMKKKTNTDMSKEIRKLIDAAMLAEGVK